MSFLWFVIKEIFVVIVVMVLKRMVVLVVGYFEGLKDKIYLLFF